MANISQKVFDFARKGLLFTINVMEHKIFITALRSYTWFGVERKGIVKDIPVPTREEKCPVWAQVENKCTRDCN